MIGNAHECDEVTRRCGPERQKPAAKANQQSQPLKFESFVQRHQTEVFAITAAIAGDALRADRIAQDVFLEAYRISTQPFRRFPSRLRMCELAVRLAVASPNERSLDPGRYEALALLTKLKDRDCTLLVLREVLGYPLVELSAVCGNNEDKLRFELFRIRQRAVALNFKAVQ